MTVLKDWIKKRSNEPCPECNHKLGDHRIDKKEDQYGLSKAECKKCDCLSKMNLDLIVEKMTVEEIKESKKRRIGKGVKFLIALFSVIAVIGIASSAWSQMEIDNYEKSLHYNLDRLDGYQDQCERFRGNANPDNPWVAEFGREVGFYYLNSLAKHLEDFKYDDRRTQSMINLETEVKAEMKELVSCMQTKGLFY